MRRYVLACLLLGSGCSRGPAPAEIYAQAWSAMQEGRLEEAYRITSKALEAGSAKLPASDSERLHLLHCEILLARGHAPEALPCLGESSLANPQLQMRWMADRADALRRVGNSGEAVVLLDNIDQMIANTSAEKIDSDARFRALMVRFQVLVDSDHFQEARDLLLVGSKLAEEDHSSFERAVVLLNQSYSRINRGRFDEALQLLQPCLEAAEQAKAGQIVALAHDNLGISYRVLGDLDRAEEHQNKSIEQLRQMGDLGHLQDALGALGNIDLERHQPERAAKDFQQAFEIAKSIGATIPAARWAGQVASALIDQQEWNAADSWNRQAYDLYSRADPSESTLVLKLNEGSIAAGLGNSAEAMRLFKEALEQSEQDAYVTWSGHVRLARVLAREKRFGEANSEYELALDVLDKRGASFGITYRDRRIEFFKDYVELLVSQHKEDRALQVVEFSRARSLAEKLGLQSQAIALVNLHELRQYARQSGSVLLSYWLAPKRSFVWIVKPDRIQMREIPRVEELEPAIRIYRKMIEEDSRDPVAMGLPQGERLSKMLLGPVIGDLAGAKHVFVAPDGPLHSLNLETLPVPGAQKYWIEDVEISIAPSLSVLAKTTPPRHRTQSLLLVGAPLMADKAFPELPGAASEIKAIQTRFSDGNVVVRSGQNATPRNFFGAMPQDFSMIHFAAHAEANPKSPLESAVILSRDGDRYKLYAHEIADMKLSAELVTLSACHSAGARTYGGEGLVGFAWAFLQSGVRSVIAGLWEVSDGSSSRLMDLLYQKLAAGLSPASALHQAKLELLQSKSYRKPFFWGPFQIFIR
jgi:CHAT domain-containing protein